MIIRHNVNRVYIHCIGTYSNLYEAIHVYLHQTLLDINNNIIYIEIIFY